MAGRGRPSLEAVREAARVLARLGAAKGGRARAKKLSAPRRKEIARKAAAARWANTKVAAA